MAEINCSNICKAGGVMRSIERQEQQAVPAKKAPVRLNWSASTATLQSPFQWMTGTKFGSAG
jgi:hypothetical protein